MSYATLDYLPDLSPFEMGPARVRPLIFSPINAPGTGWDNSASVFGSDSGAILHSTYIFKATAGATYFFYSTSFFDPFLLEIYDNNGNAVAANTEADDGPGVALPDGVYSQDIIRSWVAPYTGGYFVDASWNQGSFFKFYDLQIYEDRDTTNNTYGPGGNNQLFGSLNDDVIEGGAGNDSVISLDGNDYAFGGAGDDDLNGNVGNDYLHGDAGNDTLRGGKDNDTIFGDEGNDGHLNGNLGDDSVSGGLGNDTLYGGQGNDTLLGDVGADLLSGDLGNDILYGNAGADRFTIARGGGIDWVADFNASEGDRILLAPGTAYTVSQVGGQVVIDLGGGDQLALAGVAPASFNTDWIIFG